MSRLSDYVLQTVAVAKYVTIRISERGAGRHWQSSFKSFQLRLRISLRGLVHLSIRPSECW